MATHTTGDASVAAITTTITITTTATTITADARKKRYQKSHF
jgi:hypothetical protein